MSLTEALKAARDADIKVGVDGSSLILEAPQAPPATAIDLLLRHKDEVLAALAAREYESDENELAAFRAPSKTVCLLPEGEPGPEQPCAARRGRIAHSGGALLHFCVECGRFGLYGYDVRLRVGRLGRWYCHDHRPQEHEVRT